jgi:hypothetical protein
LSLIIRGPGGTRFGPLPPPSSTRLHLSDADDGADLGLVVEEEDIDHVGRNLPGHDLGFASCRRGEVGRHWHKDAEIEVVSRNTDWSTYCGECKWSRQPVDLRELAELEEKAKTLLPSWQTNLRFVLFSRSGFKPELKDREDGKRVILVDLEDLYGTKPKGKPR